MEFEMPETLEGLTAAQLAKLRTDAENAFTALYDEATSEGATPSRDQLDKLEELSGNIESIDGSVAEIESEAERLAAAEELRGKVKKVEEAKDADESDDSDEQAEDADAEDVNDSEEDDSEDADAVDENEKEEAMAASARRKGTRFGGLPSDKDGLPKQEIKGFTMSPHVPGYKAGHVNTHDLAEAYDRMRAGSSFGARSASGGETSAMGLGSISREFPEELIAHDEKSLTAAIDQATSEKNLNGNSLVAAGGWCAPSETLYSFLDIPQASELLDLPEVNINRGGVRFPTQPDFGAVFSNPDTFFHYSEAELVEDDYTKPCYEIPCGEFEEVRLDAIGMCITAGILQQKGYPEIVELYINGLLKNHMHRISQMGISTIREGSDEVIIPSSGVLGAFGALLNSIEMAIVDMRLNQRIPDGTTLEVILPVWAKPLLRADLTYRRSQDGTSAVTNQQLDAHFAARGARVQYVGEYQSGPGLPGGSTPITAWPDTIEFVVYPAGTWFRSMQNVIELGVLYDKAQLQKNRYTALFTEDSYAVAKRGVISRRYSVPVDPNGMVGAAAAIAAAGE